MHLHELVEMFTRMVCPDGHEQDGILGDWDVALLKLHPRLWVVSLESMHVCNVLEPVQRLYSFGVLLQLQGGGSDQHCGSLLRRTGSSPPGGGNSSSTWTWHSLTSVLPRPIAFSPHHP